MASAAAIADAFAHPLWLVERWVDVFDAQRAQIICEANQQQPQTALRFPAALAEAERLEKELADAGVALTSGALLISARRVVSGDVTATAAFRERRMAVQDEASQLVAALVGKGKNILDCCAAPGGKTQVMAERNPQAQIVAAELHPQRARMMREMVTAKNVEVIAQDVTTLEEGQKFDRVLADVPCSGTGTLARNPEIKLRLKFEDLADLHRRQVAILNAAIDRSAEGARIVYSTCSLETEEDEDVVAEVMRSRNDVRVIPVREVLNEMKGEIAWKDLDSLISGDFLRTLPGVHPCDGFFAAVMTKISA
jgi:16S rRNA (cytosine967-C5)-methyltransferase